MNETVAATKGRRLQKRAVRDGGWTKEKREIFLKALADSCNVTWATKAAGMGEGSAHRLRRNDAAFAGMWEEALQIGYDRLESTLLTRALEGVNAIEVAPDPDDAAAADQAAGERAGDGEADGAGRERAGPDAAEAGTWRAACARPGSGIVQRPMSALDVQLALALLNRHRATVENGRAHGRARRRATREETNETIHRKLDALARTLGEPE